MAHVQRLSGGRGWQARYRDDDRQEHARNFKIKRDAWRWLDSVTASKVRGDYSDPRAGRATVGELAEIWFDTTLPLKPSTRANYRSLLDTHVLPRWSDREIGSLTTSDIATWVAEMSAHRSASVTRKSLGVLRQIVELAVRDRRIAVNPALGLTQPRLPMTEQRVLNAAELQSLAEAMPTRRDRVLVLTLGWVGLRFGEAVALEALDTDLLRRRMRITRSATEVRGRLEMGSPKTHAARTVAIPAFLGDELAALMAESSGEASPLFADAVGSMIRGTNWKRRTFDPAARAVGLTPPPLRIHDLRHTAASLSILAGANVKSVQQQLGHRSATLTLDRYGHLFPDELDTLGDALETLRLGAPADSVRIPDEGADVVAIGAGL